jgi:predicted RNA binding protein YcfA (HicA-like mRNA interferase family)
MPSALPVLSGREVVRVFETFDWQVVRQSASHIIMVKEGEQVTLSIPDHREVARGTLRSLIRNAGLTVQEFVAALK